MKLTCCNRCRFVKAESEFYQSSPTICKECLKRRAKENRRKRIGYYRAYDRARGNRQNTKYIREHRKKYPAKYKAQTMVGNALRDKRLFKEPCEICESEQVHAHHDDYLKPLDVRWLCAAHHRQWHVANGEGKNLHATADQFEAAIAREKAA